MLEFYGILIFLMCESFRIVKILEQRDACANSWSNNPYITYSLHEKFPTQRHISRRSGSIPQISFLLCKVEPSSPHLQTAAQRHPGLREQITCI